METNIFNSSKLMYFILLFLVVVYSNSTQDVVNPLLYQGFIEETVELLELDQPQFSVSLLTQLFQILTAEYMLPTVKYTYF